MSNANWTQQVTFIYLQVYIYVSTGIKKQQMKVESVLKCRERGTIEGERRI